MSTCDAYRLSDVKSMSTKETHVSPAGADHGRKARMILAQYTLSGVSQLRLCGVALPREAAVRCTADATPRMCCSVKTLNDDAQMYSPPSPTRRCCPARFWTSTTRPGGKTSVSTSTSFVDATNVP